MGGLECWDSVEVLGLLSVDKLVGVPPFILAVSSTGPLGTKRKTLVI